MFPTGVRGSGAAPRRCAQNARRKHLWQFWKTLSWRFSVATLEDVARHAGVSLATASRVLNGSTRQVGASLRTKVERAAAQLGYRTNVAAQTLAKGASNVIGLVVHDLTDPYFAALADGAMRAAESQALHGHGRHHASRRRTGDRLRRDPERAAGLRRAARRIPGRGPPRDPQAPRGARSLPGHRRAGGLRGPGPAGREHGGAEQPRGRRRAGPGPRRAGAHGVSPCSPAPRADHGPGQGARGSPGPSTCSACRRRRSSQGSFDRDGGYAAASQVYRRAPACSRSTT